MRSEDSYSRFKKRIMWKGCPRRTISSSYSNSSVWCSRRFWSDREHSRSTPVTTSIPSRMVPSPAAFTPLPRDSGLRPPRESLPRELVPLLLEPEGSGPQSSSPLFPHEQQPQQRAQKERPPPRRERERLSGSGTGSGSGDGVVGGCQGLLPQRPTSERGPSIVPHVWTNFRQGCGDGTAGVSRVWPQENWVSAHSRYALEIGPFWAWAVCPLTAKARCGSALR